MNVLILDRVIWLVFSMGLAILSAVTLAYIEQIALRASSVKKWWYFLRNPWVNNVLRFLYAICIPAIALFVQGVLTYRGLGFKPLPWTPIGAENSGSWLIWLDDFEALIIIFVFTGLVLAYGLKSVGESWQTQKPDLTNSLISASRESLIDQAHWAFYRELSVTIWGFALGSWIVLIPLAIELLLNPATWTKLKHAEGRTSLIILCGILFASTMLFIQTRNLWMMLILEFILRLLFARVLAPSISLQRANHNNPVRVDTIGIT